MTSICTPRIHERFRKEWFEILDTREHNSFHFNHSLCSNICFWAYFFHYSNKLYLFLSVNWNREKKRKEKPYVANLILISNDHLQFIQLKKNLGDM
jgi:hypothetical protein